MPTSKPTPVSVGEALPLEIQRVSEIMGIYQTFPTGRIAARMMQHSLDLAQQANAEQDPIKMIHALEDLKGYHE